MSLSKYFRGNSRRVRLLGTTFIIILWFYLWYFPWQARLHHIYWLQMGVGLAIFVVPGLGIYGLLSKRPNFGVNHITFGFVLSHLLLALLGTLGRFVHVSFEVVVFAMMALGIVSLLVTALSVNGLDLPFKMNLPLSTYILTVLPMVLVTLLVCLIVIQRGLGDDDITYLTYITRWQHSSHLDFNDLIFNENQLVSPRFWLMSVPFAQAFLAEVAHIPGILILGGYYEPFLVILSVFCWYQLAVELRFSPWQASAAVLLQLSFLLLMSEYLHPGAPFFSQLSVDKATAAYILAPIFSQSLIRYLNDTTSSNLFLFLLTGLSLTFMHPIILAYSACIGGLLILLDGNIWKLWDKVMLIIILIIIMLPQVAIRFVKVPAMGSSAFDPEVVLNQSGSDNLVTQWGNTPFYGFNHNILTMRPPYEENIPLPDPIIKWGWLSLPILAAVVSLKQLDKRAAQFILACFLLCFLTWFPLTGWILGYFLNARMLARSVWLFPFGLGTVYLLSAIKMKTGQRFGSKISKPQFIRLNWMLAANALCSIALFLLFLRENGLPDFEQFMHKSIRYQEFSTAGQTLDQLIPNRAVVMGSPDLNDFIPGVSWKSQLVTFRVQLSASMVYFTPSERETRISDTQTIFSPSTSAADKMSLLRKYDVRFLLLQGNGPKSFADLIDQYHDQITITETDGIYIIQIN